MLPVTHFAIPFYSYYLIDRRLNNRENKKECLIHSSIVGLTGLLPDLFSIHVTLSARHNSISHTILATLLTFLLCSIFLFFKQIPNRYILWFPLAISMHLFLDSLSGGIKLLYPSESIFGSYILKTYMWVFSDVFFLSLLYLTYSHKKIKTCREKLNNTIERQIPTTYNKIFQ